MGAGSYQYTLLHVPGGPSGEFWNGKEEGGVANSDRSCCVPAMGLLAGGFPLSFLYAPLLSVPLLQAFGAFSPWCPESWSVLAPHCLFPDFTVFFPRRPSTGEIPDKGDPSERIIHLVYRSNFRVGPGPLNPDGGGPGKYEMGSRPFELH